MMSFTPLDDAGPKPDDRVRLVAHWCQVVAWLCQQYPDEYGTGDLQTRWVLYHTVALVADTAKALPGEINSAMVGIDWKNLAAIRTFLVHRPWDVNPWIVRRTAVTDIPLLLSELRRVTGFAE